MYSILCSQGFLLDSEVLICWKDSSGPEDNLILCPIMVILQIFCLSVTEAFLNSFSTFIALVPYVHHSLVEKLCSLWDLTGCWEPCTCCPDRDQSRTSLGRVREMYEVCVQRCCCEVRVTGWSISLGSIHTSSMSPEAKSTAEFPSVDRQASSASPARSARSDLTTTVSVQQQSLLPCLVVRLLCCWDRISSFKAALNLAVNHQEEGS